MDEAPLSALLLFVQSYLTDAVIVISSDYCLTDTRINSGTLLTDKDGTQYFVMGKVRIKVSEHFAQDGKPLDSLLEDVIQHAAAAS